jgi:hypothetical protein
VIKSQNKICQRCAKHFECNANNIAACECSRVSLNEKELKFIKENFKDCICANCLMEIQNQALNNTL